jgi:hypothetical protein
MMARNARHALGNELCKIGTALVCGGSDISDDAIGVRGMRVSDKEMLDTLRKQVARLEKLMVDATAILGDNNQDNQPAKAEE